MVLDIFDSERDVLIFKNTFDDPQSGLPKKFEIQRTDPNAPTELYFVHIEVENLANLPSQKDRWENKMQEITTRQNRLNIHLARVRDERSQEQSSKSKSA